MTSAHDLLARLVAIDSVSARSNWPMLDVLDLELQACGFTTERQVYAEGKANLIARRGGPGAAGLALVGHTDTVPYDAGWAEALTPVVRNGRVFGRGACDTKAFIACAVAAASRAPVDLRSALWLIFTGDEEIGCQGARDLERRGELRPLRAIIGEPTQLQPVRGGKGYCLAEVIVRGAEGHSAYLDTGASALRGARLFLDELDKLQDQLRQAGNSAFAPPYTTLNVGVLSAGKAKNIIPGEARFTLEWRPVPGQRGLVASALDAIVLVVGRRLPRLSVEVLTQRGDEGFMTSAAGPLVAFLERQSGQTSTTVAFGTEAPELIALGAEAVVFGPGDIRVAHQTGEYVPLDELARCEEILLAAIAEFCG